MRWQRRPDLAPTLTMISENFNKVVSWVAAVILLHEKVKPQVAAIRRFILLAEQLIGMQAYNTAAAVLSGLSHISVTRLKKTQRNIPESWKSRLQSMTTLFSAEMNYARYRSALGHSPPVIPFLPVTLRDIAFICEGNPDYLDDDKTVINISKLCMITDAILRLHIRHPSNTLESFGVKEISGRLLEFFHKFRPFSEDDLYEKSLDILPIMSPRVDGDAS